MAFGRQRGADMIHMRAMPNDAWPGGYVRKDRNGRAVYVIRRQFRGTRYVASTGRSTLAAAMVELARWEKDPEGYDPRGEAAKAILLTAERAVGYLEHSRAERHSGDAWLLQLRGYLLWWVQELRGVDLRRLTPARAEESLARAPGSRPHRIEALRGVVSWLHRRGDLEVDPLVGRLPVPQARPSQWRKPRTVTRKQWEKVTEACPEPWRSCMVVLGTTGWHLSELARFAKAGTIDGDVLDVVAKSGERHRTRVPPKVLLAALAVRARGHLRPDSLVHAVGAVADELGIAIRPGAARHCVSTWAIEAGATMADVATYLGHKSERTTRRHYAALAVPVRPKGI